MAGTRRGLAQIEEGPRHVREADGHVVGRVGQHYVVVADGSEDHVLPRWTAKAAGAQWAGGQAGLDAAVFGLESAARSDLALDALFIRGLEALAGRLMQERGDPQPDRLSP